MVECQNNGGDPLLELYCIVETLDGSVVSIGAANYADQKLKSLGFSNGLNVGLPTQKKTHRTSLSWQPILEYESNINGGNKHRDLVVGNYVFQGDEGRVRKDGLLAGFGMNFTGSYFYGPGRYMNLALKKEYKYNFQYKLSVDNHALSACSMNHVYNCWSLDFCFNEIEYKKKFSTNRSKNLNISGSKIITLPYSSYTKFGVGIERYIDQNMQQARISAELNAMLPEGWFVAFKITNGRAVPSKLALDSEVAVTVSHPFYGKPLTLRLNQAKYEGGKFFGLDWSEKSNNVSIEYPLTPSLTASLGFQKKTSNINYFEEDMPIFGLLYKPFRF